MHAKTGTIIAAGPALCSCMSTACHWGIVYIKYCVCKIRRRPSSVVHNDNNRWQTIFIEYFLYVYENRQAVDGHGRYDYVEHDRIPGVIQVTGQVT